MRVSAISGLLRPATSRASTRCSCAERGSSSELSVPFRLAEWAGSEAVHACRILCAKARRGFSVKEGKRERLSCLMSLLEGRMSERDEELDFQGAHDVLALLRESEASLKHGQSRFRLVSCQEQARMQ